MPPDATTIHHTATSGGRRRTVPVTQASMQETAETNLHILPIFQRGILSPDTPEFRCNFPLLSIFQTFQFQLILIKHISGSVFTKDSSV